MNKKRLARLLLLFLSIIPNKYPVRTKSDPPDPFFIINSGRCGSTLLNRLLNQHSQIFLPPEQYFIHNLIIKFRLYNWILWRDLGKVLAGELVSSLGSHTWDWQYESLFRDIVLAKGDDRGLKRIIDQILRSYAGQTGADPAIWGDATPLNAHYIQELYGVYPNARYLFLVRDGRDVVASYQGREDAPNRAFTDHVKCAKNWRYVAGVRRWLERKGATLHQVRYEDLVQDTPTVTSGIVEFLQMVPEPLDTEKVQVPDVKFYESPYHSELKKPIHTQRIGRWQTILSERQIKDIMPIIEQPMRDLGYLE